MYLRNIFTFRKVFFFSLLLHSASLLSGQETQLYFDPYVPEPLPSGSPEWLREIELNPSGVNYFKMDSLFRDWCAKDIDARVKTLERKPAVNFYRRWAKAYRDFVNAEGRIVLPQQEDYAQKVELQNRQVRQHLRAIATEERRQPLWRNIGPNRTAENNRGKLSEKDSQVCVFRLAVAPSNHNVVYSGTETGVVFRSDNKGLEWQACDAAHNFGGSIYAIAVSPRDENLVLVGAGTFLWKSTDGGKSWTRLTQINARVNSIRFSPQNPRQITIATHAAEQGFGGFWRSDDAGASWLKTLDLLCHDHELKPDDPNTVYLLAQRAPKEPFFFYVSTDGGQTFQQRQLPVEGVRSGRLAVSEAPTGTNYVYALVNAQVTSHSLQAMGDLRGLPHILKSTDAGLTWSDQTTRGSNLRFNTFSPFIDNDYGGQGYFDMMIGVSNKDPELVIYGLCNAYRSTTGGTGSVHTNAIGGYERQGNLHPDIQDIAIAGDDTYISTDGGIKYSTDFFATPGQIRHQGIYASEYHGFDQGWNEDVMVGGRWHNGDAVHAANYGEGNTLYVGGVEQATGHVMVSDPYKVYFSDAGRMVMPREMTGQIDLANYGTYFSKKPYEVLQTNGTIAFDPRYALRLVINPIDDTNASWGGPSDKVYLSTDEGRSFSMLYGLDGENIANFAYARSNPDYFYISGAYDIYRTIDGGKNWSLAKTRPFPEKTIPNGITQIAIHPRDEKKLWAVNPNEPHKLVYSTDAGDTWTPDLSPVLRDQPLQFVIVVGDERNGIYVATGGRGARVYYKDDSLEDWIDYSEGINPGSRIARILPYYKEGKLRMATDQGIWEAPLYRPDFVPVAQPMATNVGSGDLTGKADMPIQLESYSIVNQSQASWRWSFFPKPKSVSNPTSRNPIVVFGYNASYDVTLTVTTPQGSDTKTVKKMFVVRDGVEHPNPDEGYTPPEPSDPTGINPEAEVEQRIKLYPTVQTSGQTIRVELTNLREDAKLTLHSAKGHELRHVALPAGSSTYHLTTEGLTPGVYLYSLLSRSEKHYGRIIIK
ncbi:hypothetical protein [Porphyromonas sp. COT-290 OH860]|uniref:VPS10 domain-containing protein n=1 Tax=Porphyromonas sp. COT-290 OH860 TaxID=1515615 RepID=UPI0009DD37A7|nr:hypothetical protein [Porphyromonas sp. COT-290 OH860]